MQEIHTLVTFSSRMGETEKLTLAAGLGAVQARSLIRIRWLRENVDDQDIAAIPGWRENRDRMVREYIGPREIDFLWADVLILGMPARDGASSPELNAYLDGLRPLHAAGKLGGKVATAFTANSELVSLCSVLDGLGLTLIAPDPAAGASPIETARLHGQKLTQMARGMKQR